MFTGRNDVIMGIIIFRSFVWYSFNIIIICNAIFHDICIYCICYTRVEITITVALAKYVFCD